MSIDSSQENEFRQSEFERFRDFLQEACGISLGENKQYLISSRIKHILVENQLRSLSELVEGLQRSRHSKLRSDVINAMTTNETFWFRDTYPFDYLKQTLLPQLQEEQGGPIRIWSAACSSGQEPYSISMAVEEYRRQRLGGFSRQVEIVATDLSTVVMDIAKAGEYDHGSVLRGLEKDRLDSFFDVINRETWRIKPSVRERVEFRELNLLNSYAALGKFDIIFCRNVLIYFAAELKSDILRRMRACLNTDGYLILGSSEGIGGATEYYDMLHCDPGIVYRAKQ